MNAIECINCGKEPREKETKMGMSYEEVECLNCGKIAFEDAVEGFCFHCGNEWVVDEDLFEERIAFEFESIDQ